MPHITRHLFIPLVLMTTALPAHAQSGCENVTQVVEAAAAALPFAVYESQAGNLYRLSKSLGSNYCGRQAHEDQPAIGCSIEYMDRSRHSTDELDTLETDYLKKGETLITAIQACPGFEDWPLSRSDGEVLGLNKTGSSIRLTSPTNGQQIVARTDTTKFGSRGRFSYAINNEIVFTTPPQ